MTVILRYTIENIRKGSPYISHLVADVTTAAHKTSRDPIDLHDDLEESFFLGRFNRVPP